ncbi:MAG: 2-oxoacid:acceptor oxidoreductase family protein [Dehalococcoidia bacterium]|nr:2-oxoacid:acceptor oxidoreductase family protein [Dehalococcoidia bacterium]
MGEIKQILLCGSGGQGIVLAGKILGYAAFKDGKWVSGANSYGAAARGGECESEVVISDKAVSFPHVIEADFLIAMHPSAYNRYISSVRCESGLVIYDRQLISPKRSSSLKHIGIPATETAVKELSSKMVANIIILGAAIEITKVVTKDAFISALEENMPERFRELNLRAANIGLSMSYNYTTKHS